MGITTLHKLLSCSHQNNAHCSLTLHTKTFIPNPPEACSEVWVWTTWGPYPWRLCPSLSTRSWSSWWAWRLASRYPGCEHLNDLEYSLACPRFQLRLVICQCISTKFKMFLFNDYLEGYYLPSDRFNNPNTSLKLNWFKIVPFGHLQKAYVGCYFLWFKRLQELCLTDQGYNKFLEKVEAIWNKELIYSFFNKKKFIIQDFFLIKKEKLGRHEWFGCNWITLSSMKEACKT